MGIKNWAARYEQLERPNLEAAGAIWDVHLVKVMAFFIGLACAKVFPTILALDLRWYLLFALFAGLRPGIRSIRRMLQPR